MLLWVQLKQTLVFIFYISLVFKGTVKLLLTFTNL